MQQQVLPVVKGFRGEIETFRAEHKTMLGCVAAFDVTLATKANKTAVGILREEVKQRYMLMDEWFKVNERI